MEKNLFLKFTMRGKVINCYDLNNPITHLFKKNIYWDEDNYDIFQKYRRPNSNFIDGGSYIGTASLLMYDILTLHNENNLIYAFEPINHPCTEKNIIDNNLEKSIILNKVGLGSKNCRVDLWNKNSYTEGQPGASVVHLNGLPHDESKKTLNELIKKDGDIEIRTLDSYNYSNIGFIKLDCEGMELDILNGAINTIKNNNFPPIFIEIWKQDGWRKDVEYYKDDYEKDIYDFLIKLGYYKGKQINHDDHIFLNEEDYKRIHGNDTNIVNTNNK